MRPSPLDALFATDLYRAKLAQLEARWRAQRRLDRVTADGLSLLDLGRHAPELVRRLVAAMRRDDYELGPLREVRAELDGKLRTLYLPDLTDALVLAVLADRLGALVGPTLSNHVYSYRRGRSSWQAVRALRHYLRVHRRERDVRSRGLHGLHRDVTRYGESIRTEPDAPLWRQLERVLAPHRGAPAARVFERLLTAAIRPRVVDPQGVTRALDRGLATGVAVQPALCNLHLTDLDRELEGTEGAFYARFGDDLLLLHPSAAAVQASSEAVDREFARLGLCAKPEKRQDFYFTGCGRRSTDWPEATGRGHIEFLGARIAFTGSTGLKREKARRLVARLFSRLRNTAGFLHELPLEERARALAAVVSDALDPRSPVAEPAAGLLRHVLDDRRQLGELDHLLALAVAEHATGRRGPRAFRDLPPRRLRELGLVSLVSARNWGGRLPFGSVAPARPGAARPSDNRDDGAELGRDGDDDGGLG